MKERVKKIKPVTLEKENLDAINAWGMMGNSLNMSQVNDIGEYFQVEDYDYFISALLHIKRKIDEAKDG